MTGPGDPRQRGGPRPSQPAPPWGTPPGRYPTAPGQPPTPTTAGPWPHQSGPPYFGPPPTAPGPLPASRPESVRGWWSLTVATAVLTVGLLVALVVYRPSHPATQPVSTSALSDVLLSPEEAAHAVGANTMTGEQVQDKLTDTTIVDEDCAGMATPAQQKAYENSGWTAVRSQELGDQPAIGWRLTQAAVSFPDAHAAAGFVASLAASWQKCANREINTRDINKDDPRNIFWKTESASQSDGILTMDMIQEAQGWNCQRSLSSRNNVVVDLDLCGRNAPGSIVAEYVNGIERKVDAHS
jgi:hypothetical protein